MSLNWRDISLSAATELYRYLVMEAACCLAVVWTNRRELVKSESGRSAPRPSCSLLFEGRQEARPASKRFKSGAELGTSVVFVRFQ